MARTLVLERSSWLTWMATLIGTGLMLMVFSTVSAANPVVGQPAPAFSGTDTAGTTRKLSDYKGKVVVLEWTNDGCPYVQRHYGSGNMQALQKEATAQEVVWLSVISSAPGTQGHVSPAEADRLTRDRDATPSAVILDPKGTIGRAYDAKTTPHMYVIDKAGVLRYMGAIDDNPNPFSTDPRKAHNFVRAALGSVMSGQEVEQTVTRAYGCSVKYGYD